MVLNPGFTQFGGILHRRQERFGVIGVIAGDLRAKFHFAAALLNEFPHLLASDFCQLLRPAIDQISQLMQYRQPRFNIAFCPGRMVERIRLLQRRLHVRIAVRRVRFNKLIVRRIHRLIGHIACLLVIAIKAVKNAVKDIKGSRDGWRCG